VLIRPDSYIAHIATDNIAEAPARTRRTNPQRLTAVWMRSRFQTELGIVGVPSSMTTLAST
jgi:hypothetical protein